MKAIAVILLVPLLGACSHSSSNRGGSSGVAPSVSCKQWEFQYSPGLPKCTNGTFAFPQKDGAHYLVRKAPKGLKIGSVMTMQFQLAGSGVLVPTQLEPPARVRLYIQTKGDTLTAGEPDKRWWSGPVDLVGSGDRTITATLDPNLWTNVNGLKSDGGFRSAIKNAGVVGITFGGVFAGHGVYAKGPVDFKIISFSVN